jgi:hypothetical protein
MVTMNNAVSFKITFGVNEGYFHNKKYQQSTVTVEFVDTNMVYLQNESEV